MNTPDKQHLRQKLRSDRRALSPRQQQHAADKLSQLLLKQPLIQQAQHIAFYWPSDGEMSPAVLAKALEQQGKTLYLPAVSGKSLQFKRYSQHVALKKNRFGILEPCHKTLKPVRQLDIILMPLVGFDACGERLGMGGGFYDRTLAFKQYYASSKPKLIGLAHDCQQVDQLSHDNWDIPLNAIATASRWLLCSTRPMNNK